MPARGKHVSFLVQMVLGRSLFKIAQHIVRCLHSLRVAPVLSHMLVQA
jgi:hypothetical protein